MWVLIITLALAAADDARAAYERGRRLYELGRDLVSARAALDDAIRLDPALAEAYLYRALVVEHDHGYAPARPDFEQATALAPGKKEIWRHHAQALVTAGEPARAEAYYLVAIALDPRYGEAWYLLGRLYRKSGRAADAIRAFERDVALTPKSSAHHDLGEIFLELGDDERAARELELDLAVDPTCYESRQNLAGLALERGDPETARRHYEESLLYHPADGRSLSGLGRAYLALGDLERAVGALRSAAELVPTDERIAAALARARWRLRLHLGWPFALVPGAIAVGLVVHLMRVRKRTPGGPS